MATYVNDLRLKEIGTGDSSGTWGTETNTNLELIGEALGFGTEAITTNADTHTTLVADGGTDPGRAIYIKYTGTLDSTCTITISPNTMSRMHFIENGTSGSQDIAISQGTGSNVTIPAGDVKAVYLDGAGSGAAVNDAFASLNVVDLKVQDDLTVTDDLIVNGDIDLEGAIDVNGTANLDVVDIDGAVDMASTLQVDGAITSSAGATITLADNTDNLTLTSTDADAAVGPNLRMYRNSGSPADNDYIGEIQFEGRNDNSQDVVYAGLATRIVDASDGTEDGRFELYTILAGAQISRVLANSTETVINQDSADLDFRVESNGNANMLFVDAGNDRLGVGTASPGTDVHIYSAADNAPHLLLENFQNADTDDAAVIELYLNDQTTGGIGDDTDVGVIRFTGDEKDGGTKETYAEIRGVAHDPGQGASNKGNLSFFIQAAGALNETFILDEKVVGINDSAPSYTLDVNTSGNSSGFRVTNGTNGQDINCLISNGGTTAGDDSLLDLSVAAGAGDPKIRFSISGTENFEMGIDNTDSDLFKISNGTALGTSDLLTLNSGGSMFLGATAAVDGEFVNISKNGTTKVLISCLENSSARDAILSMQTRNGGSQCRINFADGSGAGTGSGQIFYNHDGNTLTFITDGTENMVLDSSGNLTIQGSYSPSDGRLKENIEDFTYDIEKFKAYSPKTFDWINPEEHGGKTQQIGFIAQEQEAIDPRFVEEVETDADRKDTKLLDTITKLDGDVKGISKTSEFVQKDAMYISIIQQLITRLETAEQKIAALEGGN
jgi:hypothetical protein